MKCACSSVLAVFLYVAQCVAVSPNPFDDGLLYGLNWAPEKMLTDGEPLYMRTKDNERYVCRIPPTGGDAEDEEKDRNAEGMKPADALAPLLSSGQCVYEVQTYWTYEYCPGRQIKQFHEEQLNRKRKRTAEYVLGQELSQPELAVAEENRKIPKRRIGEKDYPYYSVMLTEGTQCDVTGTQRQTEVLYICEESADQAQLLSIKETRSCEYEAIIATSLLCSLPSYRVPKHELNGIQCVPAEGSPSKPKKQVEFEKAQKSAENTASNMVRVVLGNKQAIVLKVNRDSLTAEQQRQSQPRNLEENSENPSVNFLAAPDAEQDTATKSAAPDDSYRDQPLSRDLSLVRQFVRGEFCLHGGQGWWRYEFCYGRHVHQYHVDEATKHKTVNTLGTWQLREHKHWFAQASNKKKFPKNGVVHYYSNGDVCDVTGSPRVVSVRLRCAKFDNPHQVSMYLEEPATCSYVLTIESNIVCDLLKTVDSDGLLHLNV